MTHVNIFKDVPISTISIEEKSKSLSAPTVKQHLAALRMLFDYLVLGQALTHNPAASVRGPRQVVKEGKTPGLSGPEAKRLLESVDVGSTRDVHKIINFINEICFIYVSDSSKTYVSQGTVKDENT